MLVNLRFLFVVVGGGGVGGLNDFCFAFVRCSVNVVCFYTPG